MNYKELESKDHNTHERDNFMHDSLKGSFYDLNYADIPFCWLTRQVPSGLDKVQISYTDSINFHGNKTDRSFIVEALALKNRKELQSLENSNNLTLNDSMLGFGGPWTLDIVYELHQLWVENGKNDSDIALGTVYQFLSNIRRKNTGGNIRRLKNTLKCLNGIHVKAKDSIYNNSTKKLVSMDFYLFPNIREVDNKYLFVSIDHRYFKTIKLNSLMWVPFNADYFYSLTPLQKRLALYLGKIFNPRRYFDYDIWKRDIVNLSKQMPLNSTSMINSYRTIKRALDSLIDSKFPFIDRYEYKNGIITFINKNPNRIKQSTEKNIDIDKFHKQSEFFNKIKLQGIIEDLKIDNKKLDDQKFVPESRKFILDDILELTKDYSNTKFYNKCILSIPKDLIYQIISEVRQEGINKTALFRYKMTKILKQFEMSKKLSRSY